MKGKVKLAIMQPYFVPYIGYWQLINAVDMFVIYDDVAYINRGYINRNYFLVNNEKKMLSISLSGASQNKLIKDITICDDFTKFMKTIQFSYVKAPFFSAVYALLEEIVSFEDRNLDRFIGNSIRKVCNYCEVETDIIFSSDVPKDTSLRAQAKIIDICQLCGAETYVNAIGGKELYDADGFKEHGMELRFIRPTAVPYRQFGGEFFPWLSIVDVLMFNDKTTIRDMLEAYTLE